MSIVSPPTDSTEPMPPPQPSYGLLIALGILASVGMITSLAVGLLLGNVPVAVFLAVRVAVLAAIIGGALVLGRLIAGMPSHRLLTGRRTPGDLSCLGVLVGLLVLPVYLAPKFAEKDTPGYLARGQGLEISGPTLEGGHFDLADYRGKVVLVDFWATWCRPCVEELPNVQAVYEEFHDRGLEVVSISLDQDRAALDKFLQARPLPWPQVFFDPRDEASLRNHPSLRYNIHSIPCLLVIDPEGKLITRNVRGEEIRLAVAEALGVSTTGRDGLAAVGARVLRAPLYSVLASPLWLLFVCGWGGALVMALTEVVVRRVFGRR